MTVRRVHLRLCVTLMVGVAFGAAPPSFAQTANLTAHGTTITPVVDIYRLAAPVVQPARATSESAPRAWSRRRTVATAAAIGAAGGCVFGYVENRIYGEPGEGARLCAAFAPVGAGVGALVALILRRDSSRSWSPSSTSYRVTRPWSFLAETLRRERTHQ